MSYSINHHQICFILLDSNTGSNYADWRRETKDNEKLLWRNPHKLLRETEVKYTQDLTTSPWISVGF